MNDESLIGFCRIHSSEKPHLSNADAILRRPGRHDNPKGTT